MIHGHGGNVFALANALGCLPGQILDFSNNINPLGTMPEIRRLLEQNLDSIVSLPEVDNRGIILAFCACNNIPDDQVLAGSGTTQFIYALPKALKMDKALILAPTYSDYADGCRFHGVACDFFFARDDKAFCPDLSALSRVINSYDTVYICNPNNPTGCLIPGSNLLELCETHPETRFIIDESYLPFAPDGTRHSLLNSSLPNLIVLHSLSKLFGIPGLRIGFVKAHPACIRDLEQYLPPWSVNTLAQTVAGFLLTHKNLADGFTENTQIFLTMQRTLLMERLNNAPELKSYPSATSFVLFRLSNLRAPDLCRSLAARRILIRDCSNFAGLDDRYFRIALKSAEANQLVSREILHWIEQQTARHGERP